MKKALSKKMADNLAYYVGQDKRCRTVDACYYSGKSVPSKITEGCIVGRLLPEDVREKIDAIGPMGVKSLVERVTNKFSLNRIKGIKLPAIITSNVDMMADFQALHDSRFNWNESHNLTDEGKRNITKIVKEYDLNPVDFEKFY